jgi:transketolase
MAYAGTNVKAIGVSGAVRYGALGTSHHPVQDIAMMRATAGITIILPSDARQTREMTRQLANFEGPVYVRMGRGGVEDVYESDDVPFEIGKANTVHEGDDIAIIGCGETVRISLDAAIELKKQGIDARVIDMHTIKPLDTDVILKAAKETGRIITIEEHCVNGGLGGAVAEVLSQNIPTPLKIMGIPDEQTVTGNSPEVFKHYGLTAENVVKIAKEMVEK